MAVNGKSKGSAYERLICTTLSKWISGGERDDLFWRSAMSGGRATVGRKVGIERSSQSGDICAIDVDGHPLTDVFSIECKSYACLVLDSLIFKKKTGMYVFWNQCRTDADAAKKLPMLIAKQNRFQTLLGLSYAGLKQFKIENKTPVAYFPNHDIYLFWFEDFLKEANLENFVNEKKIPNIRFTLNRSRKGQLSVESVSVVDKEDRGIKNRAALHARRFNRLQR